MANKDWIDANTRKPVEKDADIQACVLAWHRYSGVMITGYLQFYHDVNGFLTHWMPTPDPPPGFEAWERDI